jgi:hypothetical protein
MSPRGHPCPDEGTLVAVLDGELSAAEERGLAAHLEGCRACQERLAQLRRRDEAVRRWIARHDPEPPGRGAYDLGPRVPAAGRRRRGWMAAAAVVVVSAGALASPARGLLFDGLRSWIEALGFVERTTEVDGALEASPPTDLDTAAATAFAWHGADLILTFESPQTAGRLTVEPAEDSLVTLRTPGRDVGLTVRPGRVDIDNAGAPGGDYRLAVPPSLTRVRLRVRGGGESVTVIDGLTAPRTVPLPGGTSPRRPRPSPSGGGRG